MPEGGLTVKGLFMKKNGILKDHIDLTKSDIVHYDPNHYVTPYRYYVETEVYHCAFGCDALSWESQYGICCIRGSSHYAESLHIQPGPTYKLQKISFDAFEWFAGLDVLADGEYVQRYSCTGDRTTYTIDVSSYTDVKRDTLFEIWTIGYVWMYNLDIELKDERFY